MRLESVVFMPSGIVACVVLYKMGFAESPTLRTLEAIRKTGSAEGAAADRMQVMVADNSPEPHRVPEGFQGTYVHDASNPGLAKRYNEALACGAASGAEWLLLLDQDTQLTVAYLEELGGLAEALRGRTDVVAVVPKLVAEGKLRSPHAALTDRRRLELGGEGVSEATLSAFNSGAMLRIAALQEMGGFPAEYPIDCLDHAVFARLQKAGGQVWVMRSVLEHDFSGAGPEQHRVTPRLRGRLEAEGRFFREHGSWKDQVWHACDLVRQAIGHARRGYIAAAWVRLCAVPGALRP